MLDGRRVPKSDPRVDAYGEVDELGAWLGLVRATLASSAETAPGGAADVAEMLAVVQRDLFALGARLADPSGHVSGRAPKTAVDVSQVVRLEEWTDRFEAEAPPLRRFVLSGGSPAGAMLHLARAVCRRAERRIVSLGPDACDPVIVTYVNRLSDFLFACARAVSHRAGTQELEW